MIYIYIHNYTWFMVIPHAEFLCHGYINPELNGLMIIPRYGCIIHLLTVAHVENMVVNSMLNPKNQEKDTRHYFLHCKIGLTDKYRQMMGNNPERNGTLVDFFMKIGRCSPAFCVGFAEKKGMVERSWKSRCWVGLPGMALLGFLRCQLPVEGAHGNSSGIFQV